MRLTLFSTLIIVLFSCQSNDAAIKEKELEIKAKELELKERELDLQEQGNQQSQDVKPKEKNSKSYKVEDAPEQDLIGELYDREASNPSNYLSADISYRVNLAANTIIEGKIYNSATAAGFKNVEITVFFFSKTDAVLGSRTFTVMEFVPPNSSAPLRYKITGWWSNLDHVDYRIESAETY